LVAKKSTSPAGRNPANKTKQRRRHVHKQELHLAGVVQSADIARHTKSGQQKTKAPQAYE